MRTLTWQKATARRLARSRLLERSDSLVEAARAVNGVQAQVGLAAELALGARVGDCTRADVQAALWERRELVKTWTLRGTLHIHAADDLPLWVAAAYLAAPWWHDERRLAPFGLTRSGAEQILTAIVEALDGRALTTDELQAEVAERAGPWAVEETTVIQFAKPALRWRQLLRAAVAGGHLCFARPRGSRSVFVRADQWLGGWTTLDPDEALAEAFRRYLTAYGPARLEDFVHWLGAPPAAAQRLPELLGDELERVEVEGVEAWLLAGEEVAPLLPARSVRLLPQFDCYLIGAAPPGPSRAHVVPAAAGRSIFDRGGGPNPALLLDGVVAGTWTRSARGRTLDVHVAPFRPLSALHAQELQDEAHRIGRFLQLDAALRF